MDTRNMDDIHIYIVYDDDDDDADEDILPNFN